MALLLPEPERPVTTARRSPSVTRSLRFPGAAPAAAGDLLVDAFGEVERAVPAAAAEEVVARRGLDQHRHAAARAHRNAHQRQLDLEERIASLDQREAVGAAWPLDHLVHLVDHVHLQRCQPAISPYN